MIKIINKQQVAKKLSISIASMFVVSSCLAEVCLVYPFNHGHLSNYTQVEKVSIISAKDSNNIMYLKIRQLDVYKGVFTDEVINLTASSGNNSSHLNLKEGQVWIIFYNSQHINECSGSFQYQGEIDNWKIDFLKNYKCIEDDFVYQESDLDCTIDKGNFVSQIQFKDKKNLIQIKVKVLKSGQVVFESIYSGNYPDHSYDQIVDSLRDVKLRPGLIDGFPVNSYAVVPFLW